MKSKWGTAGLLVLGAVSFCQAARPVMNDVAVDFPFDGGAVLTYTRSWPVVKHLDLGFTIGGGVIEREFDVTDSVHGKVDFETKAIVLPFIGPRASLHFEVIGISVGYGLFYADTDIEARDQAGVSYAGSEKGWGSGFYAPLLVLDFYDRKRDMFFGIGLGGFLGANYNDLEAASGANRVVTDESPIQGLTITLRTRWFGGSAARPTQPKDEF